MSDTESSNDSDELEALFDNVSDKVWGNAPPSVSPSYPLAAASEGASASAREDGENLSVAPSSANDSDELEALFDSVSDKARKNAQASEALPDKAADGAAGAASVAPVNGERAVLPSDNDSDDLEALFDSVSDKIWGGEASAAEKPETAEVLPDLKDKIRQITALFDANAPEEESGLSPSFASVKPQGVVRQKTPERTAAAPPPSGANNVHLRQIAEITEYQLNQIAEQATQFAEKIKKLTRELGPCHSDMTSKAASLAVRWDLVYANKVNIDEFKRLASDTCDYLKNSVPQTLGKAETLLDELVSVQDSGALVTILVKNALSHLEEFQSRLTNADKT